MRSFLAVAAAFLVLLCAPDTGSFAAVNKAASVPPRMELLLFEHPDCVYCQVFRRDVMPKYLASANAAEMPLRFIDIAKADVDALPLNGGIRVLPTAVLMKDGHEVDRIVGYWGPDNFFKLLAQIRAKVE
jgi:thioredoxin-related protein